MFQINVVQVKPLPQRNLELVFEDGLKAKISLDQIIDHNSEVFAPLLEDSFFQTESGVIVAAKGLVLREINSQSGVSLWRL